jgi:hypothetical protein
VAKGDIEISIDANASGAIKGFKQTETAAQRAANGINKGAKIAAVGFAAVGVGALKLAQGAADDQKAATVLANTLKNTTGATKAQTAAVETWISKQGQLTGITDDQLRPALGKLVAATHDVGKAQELAKLAMDVSAGSGKDLGMVSAALAKAQNGNVGALSRLGIKTKESVKDNAALQAAQIRVSDAQDKYNQALDKYGPKSKQAHVAASKLEYAQTKLGEAQGKVKTSTIDAAEAMKRLGATYGGSAGKQAATLSGRMKILKTELSEAGEAIGYQLIPVLTTLANIAVQKVLPAIRNVGDWMSAHKPIVIAVGASVAAFGAAFIVASVAMKIYSASTTIATVSTAAFSVAKGAMLAVTGAETVAIEGNTAALVGYNVVSKLAAAGQWALNAAMSANPIGLVVVAIVALIAVIVLAWKHSDTFRAIVTGAFNAVTSAASAAFNWIKGHWPLLLAIVTGPIGLAVLVIANHWNTIKNGASTAVDWVKSKFSGLVDFFRGLPGKIGGIFSGLWNGVAGGLKSALNAVLHLPLKIPVIETHIPGVGKVGGQTLIPALAKGGIVRARPGGTLILAGEAGRDEAVVPLDGQHQVGRSFTIEHLTIQAAPGENINSSLPRAIATLDLLYGAAS